MKILKQPAKRAAPRSLQGILWSAGVEQLDLDRDKNYIIHQVLMYGTLEQIGWLMQAYDAETIHRVFLESPQNIYTPQALSFIARVVLGLDDARLDKEQYVRTAPRRIHR